MTVMKFMVDLMDDELKIKKQEIDDQHHAVDTRCRREQE